MKFYQIRDYDPQAGDAHGAERIRDAQGNFFSVLRYCGSLDIARQHCAAFGANDSTSSRAADILVVEVDIITNKDGILSILNGGHPHGAMRRAFEGKVYEIGPRGGLRESNEYDV